MMSQVHLNPDVFVFKPYVPGNFSPLGESLIGLHHFTYNYCLSRMMKKILTAVVIKNVIKNEVNQKHTVVIWVQMEPIDP